MQNSNKTDALIDRLTQAGEEVRPMPAPGLLLTGWLAMIVLYFMSFFMIGGFREDVALRLSETPYLGEIILGLLAIIASSRAATFEAYPGESPRSRWLYYLPFAVFTGYIAIRLVMQLRTLGMDEHGMQCTVDICLFAMLPAIGLFFMLARGLFLWPMRASFSAAIAASTASYLVMRLEEANEDPGHLLLFHFLPMLAMTLLLGLLGNILLAMRTRRALTG